MKMTIDQTLRPIPATCGKCGGPSVIIPDEGKGAAYCRQCSPAWFLSFQTFRLNAARVDAGLGPIEVHVPWLSDVRTEKREWTNTKLAPQSHHRVHCDHELAAGGRACCKCGGRASR